MPKSRGRRKPAKKSTSRKRHPQGVPDRPALGAYDVGRVASPAEKIATLLLNDDVAPDLLVELLPAMLWLEKATGMPTNLCASSCITLHFAYAELGIQAQPRAVDLVVANRRTGKRIQYGRPDPHWTESTFHGHCILWLPESRRILDATVEQYPEVRRYQLGPICGRIAASVATPAQQARLTRGELPPETQIAVEREELLLLYTAVGAEYDDVVMSAPALREDLAEIKRSARNLAAWTLDQLRKPDVIERARRTPHPRVRALLDLLADAEARYDPDHLRFVLPGDPTRTPRRLDELQPLAQPRGHLPIPGRRAPLPAKSHDLPNLTVVDATAVESPDRRPSRPGLLARLRRR